MQDFSPIDATPRALIWTRGQVAQALRISEPTLAKRMPELQRAGFPGKVPGLNGWSIAAVRDWIAHSGGEYRPFGERDQQEMSGDVGAVILELEREYADGEPTQQVA